MFVYKLREKKNYEKKIKALSENFEQWCRCDSWWQINCSTPGLTL